MFVDLPVVCCQASTASGKCASASDVDPSAQYLQTASHHVLKKILHHMRSQFCVNDLILKAIVSDVNTTAIVQQLKDGESHMSIARKVAHGLRI